jgi:hypothetical protein
VGAPVMWVLLPHSLGAELLASLTLAAVWLVRRSTVSHRRRRGGDTGGEEAR